jgi:hypothetical protein
MPIRPGELVKTVPTASAICGVKTMTICHVIQIFSSREYWRKNWEKTISYFNHE